MSDFVGIFNRKTRGIVQQENLLINGDFEIAQEGTSGTASFTGATTTKNDDDTYLLDEWNLLSDTNDIVEVSQVTDSAITRGLVMRSLVATANKKFGFVQIKENKDIKHLIGNVVSLSIKIRRVEAVTNFIDNIRIGIIGWDGTVDAPLSDVVLGTSWGVAGANPTLAVDWDNLGALGFLNTPVNIPVTTSFVKQKIKNVSIPTGTENLGIFIWCDSDDVDVGNILDIAELNFNEGVISVESEKRPFQKELALAQRYFEKSYDLDIAPGTITNIGNYSYNWTSTVQIENVTVPFKVSKRIIPTAIVISNVTGVTGKVVRSGTDENGSTVNVGKNIMTVSNDGTKDFSLNFHYTLDARF